MAPELETLHDRLELQTLAYLKCCDVVANVFVNSPAEIMRAHNDGMAHLRDIRTTLGALQVARRNQVGAN